MQMRNIAINVYINYNLKYLKNKEIVQNGK